MDNTKLSTKTMVLILVGVIVIGAGAFFLGKSSQKSDMESEINTENQGSNNETQKVTLPSQQIGVPSTTGTSSCPTLRVDNPNPNDHISLPQTFTGTICNWDKVGDNAGTAQFYYYSTSSGSWKKVGPEITVHPIDPELKTTTFAFEATFSPTSVGLKNGAKLKMVFTNSAKGKNNTVTVPLYYRN